MTTETLISLAEQLPDDELMELAQQVRLLAAKRRHSSLSSEETAILKRINQEPEPDQVRRYQELQSKRERGLLDESELEELQSLSDWLEETHADRLSAVADLAQLRGLPLGEMMKQLGIRHSI